jgi:phage N-6-adenine-methyltransferase
MVKPQLFSSATDEWETPQFLFDGVNAEFGFDLDVCATPGNAKCKRFFTKEDDGLTQPWSGTCWMNPPYGRAIGRWMQKAYEESQRGCTVVALIPCRTCSRWWHDFAMRGEIRLLKGRLRFGGAKHCAPFPSAIVVFRPPGHRITQARLWSDV